MSLINEALKKAQRMRHQEPGGAPAGLDTSLESPNAPVASAPLRRGRTPSSLKLLLALGLPLLVLVSVGATWLLLSPGPTKEPSTNTPNIVAATPAPIPAATPLSIASPAPDTTANIAPTPSPAENQERPATPDAAVPLAATAPAAATKLAVADVSQAPRRDPRVHAFLDTLRVTGIRASPTDPRVSMNDRVFRLNDIVDRNLELRIVGIAPEGLTFIDPNGVVYQTQF